MGPMAGVVDDDCARAGKNGAEGSRISAQYLFMFQKFVVPILTAASTDPAFGCRQREEKRRALAQFAFRPDFAAVRLHDVLHDG